MGVKKMVSRDIVLDDIVKEDQEKVKALIRDSSIYESSTGTESGGELGVAKSLEARRKKSQAVESVQSQMDNLYGYVVTQFSNGTRNDDYQVKYLDIFEKVLGVFRASSLQLRKSMDVITLEQKLDSQNHALKDLRKAQGATDIDEKQRESEGLQREITDAIFFSNRYALYLAGQVGLALLDSDPAKVKSKFTFAGKNDASNDRDELTRELAKITRVQLENVLEAKKQKGEPAEDTLKETLEASFTSWVNQFSWNTLGGIAKARAIENLNLKYGNYSIKDGEFKKKYSVVEIGNGIMPCRKEDVIPDDEFYDVLWQSFLKLATYNPEKKRASVPAPAVIFTYGPPGCGKTFQSHALIRTFLEDICMKRGIAAKAQIHSVSDFASSYQNQTALNLSILADGIKKHEGIDIMYVADADIIFQSRKDPHMTQEQKQTNGIYMSMFDGTRIPKTGKFLTIMDANYIDGIDDATKSRVFDKIVEMKRFTKPEQFTGLAKNKLMKGITIQVLTDEQWTNLGKYLLESPLSNREIDNIITQIRGGLRVDENIINLGWDKQIEVVNDYFKTITLDVIMEKFDKYIGTRAAMEEASANAKIVSDEQRFLAWKANLQKIKEGSSGAAAH